jgi:hypothetical protein
MSFICRFGERRNIVETYCSARPLFVSPSFGCDHCQYTNKLYSTVLLTAAAHKCLHVGQLWLFDCKTILKTPSGANYTLFIRRHFRTTPSCIPTRMWGIDCQIRTCPTSSTARTITGTRAREHKDHRSSQCTVQLTKHTVFLRHVAAPARSCSLLCSQSDHCALHHSIYFLNRTID